MDLEQPAALSPLERREAAAEGAERKGEDRREKTNWNSLLSLCLIHRCLLFGCAGVLGDTSTFLLGKNEKPN